MDTTAKPHGSLGCSPGASLLHVSVQPSFNTNCGGAANRLPRHASDEAQHSGDTPQSLLLLQAALQVTHAPNNATATTTLTALIYEPRHQPIYREGVLCAVLQAALHNLPTTKKSAANAGCRLHSHALAWCAAHRVEQATHTCRGVNTCDSIRNTQQSRQLSGRHDCTADSSPKHASVDEACLNGEHVHLAGPTVYCSLEKMIGQHHTSLRQVFCSRLSLQLLLHRTCTSSGQQCLCCAWQVLSLASSNCQARAA